MKIIISCNQYYWLWCNQGGAAADTIFESNGGLLRPVPYRNDDSYYSPTAASAGRIQTEHRH